MTLTIIKGKQPKAWKTLLYGTPGAGKSTLGASAPKPFFLDFEDGLSRIDCDRSDRISSVGQIKAWVELAVKESYQTIVFDTADALEELLTAKVCEEGNKATLADFGYGRGHDLLVNEWLRVLALMNWLQAKGINVLLIGHEQVTKFEDPTSENYDRYSIKIHKKSAAVVTARMDAVLFCRLETILKERAGCSEKNVKMRGVGTGKRIIHTVEAPSWIAKNRFSLPPTVPMNAKLFDLMGGAAAKETPVVLRPIESGKGEGRGPAEGDLPSADLQL